MPKNIRPITQDDIDTLRTFVRLDSKTGCLSWIKMRNAKCPVGGPVGAETAHGYIRFSVCGKAYMVHRVVFALTNGPIHGIGEVDHIDGNRTNNVPNNLRLVSGSTNAQNQRKAKRTNRSGYLGVSKCTHTDVYLATLSVGGKRHIIKRDADPIVCYQAYLEAKRQLHVGCTI